MKITAVGTVAFDAIETPFGKTDKILGGAATYIGLSASVLDVDVELVSVVGGDFPKKYIELLSGKNIGIEGIEVIPDGKTFFWSGKYHNDMNSRDTLVTELNVLEGFNPKLPINAQNSEILLLGNLHPGVQLSVIEQVKDAKLVVLDTMNFWMDQTWDLLLKTIKKTNVLSINDSEARQLSGEYSLVKAAKKIHEMGPKYVIIKKGEHGALLFGEGEVFVAPALPLEDVFDPTGAGDSFVGGFVAYLAKEKDLSFNAMRNAVIVGSALASFSVEKFGTERIQEITTSDLNKRLKEFKQLTTFDIKL
ncbi:MAG: bifunctional hydroxymethylpyrimidine kinase/phosphomethylpyrimidine kinase [Flavobacteriales bacterium]|nr:bifunctional hydroxymethylpyrimidine kinase/phosphomethylpyrimidine kinase [Flavobacteriales bacterium]